VVTARGLWGLDLSDAMGGKTGAAFKGEDDTGLWAIIIGLPNHIISQREKKGVMSAMLKKW
jgi:hypothetical protein